MIGLYGAIRLPVGGFFMVAIEILSETIASLKRIEVSRPGTTVQ